MKHFLYLSVLLFLFSCASRPVQGPLVSPDTVTNFEFPQLASGEKVVTYTGFALVYDTTKKIPKWTAYSLTPKKLGTTAATRKDNFRADARVDAALTETLYRRSGYDRGHMVPAHDMKWSVTSMDDSFYMTNIAPQKRRLNTGIWRQLESQVRRWGMNFETIYVVTGPVLTRDCLEYVAKIVCVPAAFYKIILGKNSQHTKAIAFVIPHEIPKGARFADYALTVREAEKIAGLNFFPALSPEQSDSLEAHIDRAFWLK